MFFALLFLQSKTTTNKKDKHNILVVKLKFVAHFQIWEKSNFKTTIYPPCQFVFTTLGVQHLLLGNHWVFQKLLATSCKFKEFLKYI
jgi:hypothetical protein